MTDSFAMEGAIIASSDTCLRLCCDEDVSRRRRGGAWTPARGEGSADATGDDDATETAETNEAVEADGDKDECRDAVEAVACADLFSTERRGVSSGDGDGC
jgi:hypothetical protein